MTTKEKLLGTSLVIITLASVTYAIHTSRKVSRPASLNIPVTVHITQPKQGGYGLGETPGFDTITPGQASQLRQAGSTYGVSDKELEQLRVQAIHQGMYPEDMPGGRNYRDQKREQSRKASGYYD